MTRLKLWLIFVSVGLIALDHFSLLSKWRDNIAVYIQQEIHSIIYRVRTYPQLILLQKAEQSNLQEENVKLKKQIEAYSVQLKQTVNQTQSAKEIENLQQPNLYDDYKVIVGRAIIDVNYLINNKLLIDKGSDQGVALGSAVVNTFGVIGQVTLVNPNNSQVTLIVNPDFKIYLQESVTKTKMLAQGAGNDLISVKYINKNDKIKIGDILLTTGLDDVYPANMPVAKVVKVFYENNGFNSALCEPIVNFNNLQYVSILNNNENK